MVDSVYRTRSLGTAAEGIPDQYADGRAAKLWEIYVGDKNSRTENYKSFLVDTLRHRNCKRVLDTACGTGIDSVLLLEEGFHVTSVDASDKMLKYALRTRWNRRAEPAFDQWVIEEANWLSLPDDLESFGLSVKNKSDNKNCRNGIMNGVNGSTSNCSRLDDDHKFDAVLCLGNSFAHLPDFSVNGDQSDQKYVKLAIRNFKEVLRPGGILIIDHRNYDFILECGKTPVTNIYYSSQYIQSIRTSTLLKEGVPCLITLDYVMDVSGLGSDYKSLEEEQMNRFRLSYYPHKLDSFSAMLKEAFGANVRHEVFGDFKRMGEVSDPGFYVHVIEKE